MIPERNRITYYEGILTRYANPSNDINLTEESVREIEKACFVRWYGIELQYYRFEDPDAGLQRPIAVGEKPVLFFPGAEGYWYCPVRITEREAFGDQKVHTEITAGSVAKTTMEAIQKAKRIARHSADSWARSLVKAEVLLSGPLKFDGQSRPVWFPFRLHTEQEWEEIYREGIAFLKQQGYEFK